MAGWGENPFFSRKIGNYHISVRYGIDFEFTNPDSYLNKSKEINKKSLKEIFIYNIVKKDQ